MRGALWLGLFCILATRVGVAEERNYSPYAGEDFPRGLYWGDTHVHSSWSIDAGNRGNVALGPAEAFRFARGEEARAHNGMAVRLRRPLDFLVLTDHAEYLGVMPRLDAGDPLARSTEVGERWYQLRKQQKMAQVFGEFAQSILAGEDVIAPGQLKSHYAPSIPLRINVDPKDREKGETLLTFGPDMPRRAAMNLSTSGDLSEAAANLFIMLRALDMPGIRGIAVVPIPEEGLGRAINDRLKRASAGTVEDGPPKASDPIGNIEI